MVGFKNDSEAVEQACTRLKTAGGLGAQPAPVAKAMLEWLASKNLICCQASLHKRGGGAPVCKHTARMVNGGVAKGLI